MNEIDQLSTMRADAPYPTSDRLAAGRAHIRAVAVTRRVGYRRPKAIFAGALVAASAAAAAVLVSALVPATHAGRMSGGIRLVSASQVLNSAATAAQARPAVMPTSHQWVYVKGVKSFKTTHYAGTGWTRFDGQESAAFENGKFVFYPGVPQDAALLATPQAAAGYLASLPTQPTALLAAIYQKADTQPRDEWASPNRNARAFSILETLLWNALVGVPPAHEAAAFKAMALIPGVTVQTGLVDAAGRPAVGLGFTPGNGLTGYFLLDPRTYAVSGISSEDGAGIARILVRVVNKPGQV